MSRVSNVADLGRISNKSTEPKTAAAPIEELPQKTLTPEEEDEIVYDRVLKRKREHVERVKKSEADEKAEAIKRGIERRKKIMRIKNWCSAFKDVLGEFIKDKHLEKSSDAELDAILEECKFIVASRTTGLVTDQTAASIVDWMEEGISEHTSLQVKGPKVSLKQLASSKDCTDLVKELSLEYADFVYQRPEWRALLFLVNGVYAIHSINKEALETTAKTQQVTSASEEPKEPPTKRSKVEESANKDKDGYEMIS